MEVTERQALIVWMYTLKQLKAIKKFGYVTYISKRLKYVYLYVDQDQVEAITQKLNKLHFVRKVEPSYRPEVRMDFTQILPELKEQHQKDQLEKQTSIG